MGPYDKNFIENHKKKHPLLLKMVNNALIDLPTPSNISACWNFGSLLGMCVIIQILTGLFLASHYCPDISLAFNSVVHICQDVNFGWLLRTLHANGASFFFICIYLHVGRGLYYGSFMYSATSSVGVIILLTAMGTAFLGYVLPWSQMSFWGATVITNLLSAIPYLGTTIVQWIWGWFAVDNATLTRFFTLHFLFPFIVLALSMIHLIFLYQTGSNNPLGSNSNIDKVPFHPYFSFKDLLGFNITLMILTLLTLYNPYMLGDPDNFTPANPLVTPVHIQPEWYFLYAYAILRSIPNKLGGVIALFMSIVILLIMSAFKKSYKEINFTLSMKSYFEHMYQLPRPVEDPFIITLQILTILYFLYFPALFMPSKLWDNILFKN